MPLMTNKTWTASEIEILREYYPTASHHELSRLLPGRSLAATRKRANDLRIVRLRGLYATRVPAHSLAAQLRRIRIERRWTSMYLAKRMGVHRNQICKWEHGKESPKLFNLVAWIEALDCDLLVKDRRTAMK